jgi:hypothetical protein
MKLRTINYRGRLIELRRTGEGWATSFRKFAHIEFTDVGQPLPTKEEALAHAKRHVDWEIGEEIIADQFSDLFNQLLRQGISLQLIFEGLSTAVYKQGWSEQLGLLEEATKNLPGGFL